MIQIKFEIDLGHSCFLTASACIAALPRYLLKIHWSLYQILKKLGVKRVTYRARPQYEQILRKIRSLNLGQVRSSENSKNALHTQKSSWMGMTPEQCHADYYHSQQVEGSAGWDRHSSGDLRNRQMDGQNEENKIGRAHV